MSSLNAAYPFSSSSNLALKRGDMLAQLAQHALAQPSQQVFLHAGELLALLLQLRLVLAGLGRFSNTRHRLTLARFQLGHFTLAHSRDGPLR